MLPAGATRDLETLSVAYARLYPCAVLTGWSAAVIHGISPPRHVTVPELAVGPHGRARKGLRIRRYSIPEKAITTVRGVRVTALRWTAFDLARFGEHVHAVQAIEEFYRWGMARAAFAETVSYMAGTWGVARARKVLEDADPRSESPRETETRLILKLPASPSSCPK